MIAVEQAASDAEAALVRVEVYGGDMRRSLSRCEWKVAAEAAQHAVAAFESYLDAIQEMYRAMARTS